MSDIHETNAQAYTRLLNWLASIKDKGWPAEGNKALDRAIEHVEFWQKREENIALQERVERERISHHSAEEVHKL